MGSRHSELGWAAALLLPSLLLFVVFVLAPIVATFTLSLFRWNLLTTPELIGLDNFQALMDDPRLGMVLSNTIVFAAVAVIAKVTLGLTLAVLVWWSRPRIVTATLESALFFPVILPMAVVAMVWGLLLNTDLGIVNGVLASIGLPRIPWFTDSAWALPSIILLDVWKGLGFFVIVYLVALRNIPREVLEAARIDGAGRLASIRQVAIPLVSPTTLFLGVIATIGSLQVFDQAYILTRGGPGDASRTIVYYLWEQAFQRLNVGYGATVALLLFGLVFAITIVQMRISKRWINYA